MDDVSSVTLGGQPVRLSFASSQRLIIHVPGDLFSVNPVTARGVPGLFARKMSGWTLLFYEQLVSFVHSLLMGSIVSGIIGVVIGAVIFIPALATALLPASKIGHPAKGAIWLKVNGKTTQTGDLSEMIWNVPETISYLSGLITLVPGDLIYSGTPAGVGPVKAGDKLEGHVDGVGDLMVTYVK